LHLFVALPLAGKNKEILRQGELGEGGKQDEKKNGDAQ
jgi:hypothetical protein